MSVMWTERGLWWDLCKQPARHSDSELWSSVKLTGDWRLETIQRLVMTCLKGVKAVLARTMFSLHALVTLWRLVSQGQPPVPISLTENARKVPGLLPYITTNNHDNCNFHWFTFSCRGWRLHQDWYRHHHSDTGGSPRSLLQVRREKKTHPL